MRFKGDNILLLLFGIIVFVGIGYAYLNVNLNIDGSANVTGANWNIHWDNVQVTSGSVTANTPTIDVNGTTVSYTVTLNEPGEFYEFTVDAVNSGNIDGMISSVSSKLDNVEIVTLPNYLNYSVSYSDGTEIAANQLLAAGTSEVYKVRVEYKADISSADLPSTDQSLHFTFEVNYVQANENAVPVTIPPVSFSGDSWSTIMKAARAGNTANYHVGDTKTIDMGSYGTHTLRISNISTPSECSSQGFSQSACGIVIEFADIIDTHIMNSTNTNIGGWEATTLRTYLNSNIYNSLPDDLKAVITDTRVVSGHGLDDSANFVTTDKLYLLSLREVLCDLDDDPPYDTGWNATRQLDYYRNLVTSLSDLSNLRKTYNSEYTDWWTRTAANYTLSDDFIYVQGVGDVTYGDNPDQAKGVSPAFRIG